MSEVVLEGFWWPAEVSKFRRVLLEPLCSNSRHVRCRIDLLKFSKSVGRHNGHEWVQVIRQDAYVPITCQSHIWTYQGAHITPTAHAPYHHRASNSLNIPLLTYRFHGFMRLSPYLYTSISSIQLETRFVRSSNVFPGDGKFLSTGPGEA
ncbi:uncharacterized protein TNCV_4678091 [Trichonephila clavipes]|nr:uncharacterized protein TNCV_4678091 [Trichonephila clavipes]